MPNYTDWDNEVLKPIQLDIAFEELKEEINDTMSEVEVEARKILARYVLIADRFYRSKNCRDCGAPAITEINDVPYRQSCYLEHRGEG